MRKPLIALGLAITASTGALPAAQAIAATPASPSHSSPLSRSPSPANSVSGAAIVQFAMKYLGYPYSATGNSPSTGFSCIGFVSYVYRSLGIPLPGDLQDALDYASQVSFSDLLPGDVLYFQNTVWPGLSHAAIYIGGGRFIHAAWYNTGVEISSFSGDGGYWTSHYMTANRPWTGPASSTPITPPATAKPTTSSGTSVNKLASGPTALVSVPSLNVRSGPSTKYAVETVITQGTSVVILSHSNGWYKVQLANGTTGWVIGAGIGKGVLPKPRTAVTKTNKARITNPTAPKRVGTPVQSFHPTISAAVNGLRVHSAPSLGSSVVAGVSRGQGMEVLARRGNWVKVRLANGQVGWVDAAYISGRTATAAVKSSTHRTTSSNGSRGGTVTGTAINVRQRPSLNGPIVTVIPAGGRYQVLRWARNGWARVRLPNGTEGWVSGTVIPHTTASATTSTASRTATRSTAQSASGTVTRTAINVRQRPSLNGPIVAVVPAGGSYQIIRWARNGWARVRLPNGTEGGGSGTVIPRAGTTSTVRSSTGSSSRRVTARSTTAQHWTTGPVLTASVRVHARPSLNARVIGLGVKGWHVQLLSYAGSFVLVRLPSNVRGYIYSLYLRS